VADFSLIYPNIGIFAVKRRNKHANVNCRVEKSPEKSGILLETRKNPPIRVQFMRAA
jgi:hypothetical protein